MPPDKKGKEMKTTTIIILGFFYTALLAVQFAVLSLLGMKEMAIYLLPFMAGVYVRKIVKKYKSFS